MCVYTTTTTFVFFFLGRKPRMIQWIICKLCETPPVLPPLSSFIMLMISMTKCEILKNSKKISFLYKNLFSSKNVDIDSNFIVFDANSALFSQIEIILQILYEISRIFCGFYSIVTIQFLVIEKLLFIDLSQECRILYPSLTLQKSPHIPTNFKVCAR